MREEDHNAQYDDLSDSVYHVEDMDHIFQTVSNIGIIPVIAIEKSIIKQIQFVFAVIYERYSRNNLDFYIELLIYDL